MPSLRCASFHSSRVEVTRRVLHPVWMRPHHTTFVMIPSSIAGIQVLYDRSRAEGSRVVEVQVRCAECAVPEFRPLNRTDSYCLLAPQFLIKGGDGYTMLSTRQISHTSYGKRSRQNTSRKNNLEGDKRNFFAGFHHPCNPTAEF